MLADLGAEPAALLIYLRDVTIRPNRKAYALNGFKYPEDDLTAFAGDSGYLSAILN